MTREIKGVRSEVNPPKTIQVKVIGTQQSGRITTINWLDGLDLILADTDTGEIKHELSHLPASQVIQDKEKKQEPIVFHKESAPKTEAWNTDTLVLVIISYRDLDILERVDSPLSGLMPTLKFLNSKGMYNTILENNTFFIITNPHTSASFSMAKFLDKKIAVLNTAEQSIENTLLVSLLIQMKSSLKKNRLCTLSPTEICHRGSMVKRNQVRHFFINKLTALEEIESADVGSESVEEKKLARPVNRKSREVRIVGIDDQTSLPYVNSIITYLADGVCPYRFTKNFIINNSFFQISPDHNCYLILAIDENDLLHEEKSTYLRNIILQFKNKFSVSISDNAFLILYRGSDKHTDQILESLNAFVRPLAGIISFDKKNIINLNLRDDGTCRRLVFDQLASCVPVNIPMHYGINSRVMDSMIIRVTHEKNLSYMLLAIFFISMYRSDTNVRLAVVALLIISLLTYNKLIRPGLSRLSSGIHNFMSGTTIRIDEVLKNLNAILKSTDNSLNTLSGSLNEVLNSFNLSINILTDRADQTFKLSAEQFISITKNINNVINLSKEQMATLGTSLNNLLVVTQDQLNTIGSQTSQSIRVTGASIERLGLSGERFITLTGDQVRGIGGETNRLIRLSSDQVDRLGRRVDGLLVLSGREVQAMGQNLRENVSDSARQFSRLIQGFDQQFQESSRQIQRFIQSRDRGFSQIEQGTARFIDSRDRGFSRIEQSAVDSIDELRNSINMISGQIRGQIRSTGSILDTQLDFLLQNFNTSSQRLMEDLGAAARGGGFAPKVDVHDNSVEVKTDVRASANFCIIM